MATARGCTFVLLAALLMLTGCTDPAGGRTAEHTLELAAAGLEGVDRYGFRVKTAVSSGGSKLREIESYEGEIIGHAKLRIRKTGTGEAAKDKADKDKALKAADLTNAKLTPAARLAELQRSEKQVEYAAPAKAGVLTLRIELTADASKRDAAGRIRARFDRAAEAAQQTAAKGAQPKGGGKAGADYSAAVIEEIEQSRRQLDGMLDSLQAETVALLSIDRVSLLPLKLSETTVLQYEAAGKKREEKTVTHVEFAGFNGKPEP